METVTKPYPFDAASLSKGDRVTADTIQDAYGARCGTNKYRLSLMKAREYIVRSFAARGVIVTVKEEKNDLLVLTDEAAAHYNAATFEQGIRKSVTSHGRALGADRSQMTAPTQTKHDRNLTIQGRVLGAIEQVRRLEAAPRERSTPGKLISK